MERGRGRFTRVGDHGDHLPGAGRPASVQQAAEQQPTEPAARRARRHEDRVLYRVPVTGLVPPWRRIRVTADLAARVSHEERKVKTMKPNG